MKFTESIKKNQDFKIIYKKGKSYANKYLVMYVCKRSLAENELAKHDKQSKTSRIGISVSKKVGNSVVRHRITRLIKESYRLQEARFQCGLDIVIIARVGAKNKSYREIESALIHLGKLHNIYR